MRPVLDTAESIPDPVTCDERSDCRFRTLPAVWRPAHTGGLGGLGSDSADSEPWFDCTTCWQTQHMPRPH